jgi:hypothetical protein
LPLIQKKPRQYCGFFFETSSLSKVYFMKLLPVIFERNEADFGAIAGHYGEKIQRNCSQKEPKEQNKINFRQSSSLRVIIICSMVL